MLVPSSETDEHYSRWYTPVGFIKDDNLMSPRRQSYFLLRKHLDFVPDNIDTTFM